MTITAHQAPAVSGAFIVTLCRLAAPTSIRPPQSPHLKQFQFFTSCSRQQDGSERLYLHMGYFKTLRDAQECVRLVRGRFPEAFVAPAAAGPFGPAAHESLTDTQVMRLLEARSGEPAEDNAGETRADQVALLRPEDTETRRALKEAVVQGAPVSFAVQLYWSEQSIDVARVPALEIFKGYALYATQSRRGGRSCHFLRLGFFPDPSAATDVASQLRSRFASAAVVPIAEAEVMRVRDADTTASIPYLLQQGLDPVPDSSHPPAAMPQPKPVRERPSQVAPTAETLEQTLERLAQGEDWIESESLSESGVRHLKIEVHRPDSLSRQALNSIENIGHRMKLLWMRQQ